MTEQERRELIWRLYNPQTPDPFVSWDYGVLCRDLPPRRTLRERVRALVPSQRPRLRSSRRARRRRSAAD